MPERKIASTSSRLGTGRGGIEFWNSGILGEFKNSRIQESGIPELRISGQLCGTACGGCKQPSGPAGDPPSIQSDN